ncbi:Molybdopterin biosynthesis protein MoeA [hydrothermal vent metagenome]|uniref:Molybdopterin biosynthesis protein MoeA n=1 Tax=hydrothermal vent metagenome TaxID=652676 RepID=A0A1W1BW16_9ZZZZ
MTKNYVDFSEAVTLSLQNAEERPLKEIVGIERTLGRVFSQDVICQKNLPSFDNSAMDGFAVRAVDAGKTLKVREVIYAGEVHEASLGDDECYKIMTGAQVPLDADTIIPIERVVKFENDKVTLPETLQKGDALRRKGEERQEGDILFKKGEEITARTIAVLASQGIMSVEVFKKLSIAVVSTGNEIREPWEHASKDEIYNCNSFAIISALQSKGFDASYIKVIPDNLEETIAFVSELKSYDIIITSGGISMGDADFVGRAFEANGLQTLFDGVNIKPGRPIMMGKMQRSFVICLPGNPLTAMVNLYLFALPIIRKMQGYLAHYHNIESAKNETAFKTKRGRVNVVLGRLTNGTFVATRGNRYGSGMITVIEESDALLVTDEQSSGCTEGERVKVIRLDGLYLIEEVDIFNREEI